MSGNHGFGMNVTRNTSDLFIDQFVAWMQAQGLTRKPGDPDLRPRGRVAPPQDRGAAGSGKATSTPIAENACDRKTMSIGRVRKQVYDLTIEDLKRHSVWEFALDEEGDGGQDEATVRPYELTGPLDPSDGMFIVRAQLILADGTKLCGYLTPPETGDSSLGSIHPVVVVDGGQVPFWYAVVAPGPADIAANYARLDRSSASEIFPISFASDVELLGGAVSGELPGFLVLEDFATMRTKVLT
jgi:hypothetical protein